VEHGGSDGMEFALTYHVEGPAEQPSAEVYAEIERQVLLAEALGFAHVWFAEHHFHVHFGHLPAPLLFATYLAGRTGRIGLGSAVVCVNLHQPLVIAEQIALLDVLSGGRSSVGLGSGSTPAEFAALGAGAAERHARLAEALDILELAWAGQTFTYAGRFLRVPEPVRILPQPTRPLFPTLWLAANSPASATLAGRRGLKLMLSRERSAEELRSLHAAYRAGREQAGLPPDSGTVSASRAMYVGESDAAAWREASDAAWLLNARRRRERAAIAALPPPQNVQEAAEQVQFVVGGPERCRASIQELQGVLPVDVFNLQPRWAGLSAERVEASLRRFAAACIASVG
jgi:alkanesulfonate monooxygenase SsuD/methylene tetrahydromethanopterin reductase-like flavin-dependent oxidoreductase (luciferase family)